MQVIHVLPKSPLDQGLKHRLECPLIAIHFLYQLRSSRKCKNATEVHPFLGWIL